MDDILQPLGRVFPVGRGDFVLGTAYVRFDAVYNSAVNASFIAKIDNKDIPATKDHPETWFMFCEGNGSITDAEKTKVDALPEANPGTAGGLALYDALKAHLDSTANPHKVTAAQVGASNPNLLINADFQVAQRGTSFIPPVANSNAYTFDRWFVNGTDINTKIYQASPVESGYSSAVRIEQYLTTGASGAITDMAQFIENYKAMLGKQVTYSVRLKLDNGVKGYIYIHDGVNFYTSSQITGDGTVKTVVETATLSASGTKLMCAIRLFRDSLAVGSGLTIECAKLEVGSVPTPFVPRPYAEELAMCQRYYQRNKWLRFRIGASTSSINRIESTRQEFDVEMRKAPTMRLLRTDGISNIRTFDFSSNYESATNEQANIEEALFVYNPKMYVINIHLGTIPIGNDYIVDIKDNTMEFDAEIY